MKITYRGWLGNTSNGEEDDLLCIRSTPKDCGEILAERIKEDIRMHGNNLTVRYFIADKEFPEEEAVAIHLKEFYGMGKAEYCMRYSEYTGYLWTDEKFNVGGHDLITELKNNLSKFIQLEIEYRK